MTAVDVDPDDRTARVQAGATWADVDHETQAFGLAVPGGVVSATGVAGLTLGGGIGHLRRAHGLSCDNLRSIDLVTADGRFVTASETEHPDLFWGLRGGGGGLGVGTTFEFDLHPVGPAVATCLVFYHGEDLPAVLSGYREYTASAPDEVSTLTFAGQLSDEAIDRVGRWSDRAPSPLSTVDVWHLGGAIDDVAPEKTAFPGRGAPFLLGVEANWTDDATDDANVAWVRDCLADMERFSDGSVYLNFPGFHEGGESTLETTFGGTYDRLVALRDDYDPTDVFRVN